MPKRIVLLTLLSTSAIARAQPDLAAPEPEEPPPAEPAPVEPAPSPPPVPPPVAVEPAPFVEPNAYDTCITLRRQIGKSIEATSDRNERGRLVHSMPDCEPLRPRVEEPARASRSTSEIALGVGVFSIAGISDTKLGGLNLGVGGFVTPDLAITARLAGGTLFTGDAIGYVGLLGPNAQYWINDHFWIGGGAGLGFILVSAGGDESVGAAGSGLDFRLGYSLGERGNSLGFSVETTSFSEGLSFNAPFNDRALTVLSFLVGYQQSPRRAKLAPTVITKR